MARKKNMGEVVPGPRRTTPYLTKFECARVVGLRYLQLSISPAPPPDPYAAALVEVRERRCNAVLRRPLPDGTAEDCELRALRIPTSLLAYQLNPDRL